ncbi:rRNA maturation RNase YbeY [Idiomarina tyrosinivorans]|uniref:Endoribonuclease YbeY n=1 Tax=Idiomarina tyrosinivorans TaxID=1445662 RepID=A0A432ZRC7_9GAMM|nr:rRNA maturation RNase YbeY [Idiomarina tyrosinivorans]RUO80460.1 rRNA maturation RNase YbeY [Idiomarina tyrosinivorans]
MTDIIIDRQVATDNIATLPSAEQLQQWVAQTLIMAGADEADTELTVRFVDNDEIQQLNREYRGKDKLTNVLSFPFEAPVELPVNLLGDIVIAAEVIINEAEAQQKSVQHHWTHMIIHGTLHLLGFDHIDADEAEQMEQLERDILAHFGIRDPYLDNSNTRSITED